MSEKPIDFVTQPAHVPLSANAPDACPKCGSRLDSGVRFCPQCGEPVPTAPDSKPYQDEAPAPSVPVVQPLPLPTVGTPIKHVAQSGPESSQEEPNVQPQTEPAECPCGQALPEDARYCHSCGLRVGEVTPWYHLKVSGTAAGQGVFAMTEGELTIGKDGDCDVALAHDDYVSRRHARISRADGLFFIEDLGSSNGTFLRVRRPIVLEADDEIVVGTSVIRFQQG